MPRDMAQIVVMNVVHYLWSRQKKIIINHSGFEARIFQNTQAHNMTADILNRDITKPSAELVLAILANMA